MDELRESMDSNLTCKLKRIRALISLWAKMAGMDVIHDGVLQTTGERWIYLFLVQAPQKAMGPTIIKARMELEAREVELNGMTGLRDLVEVRWRSMMDAVWYRVLKDRKQAEV